MPATSPDPLDTALARLHRHGPEYGGGLSDHGPMVVEALAALGREDAILPWLDAYEPRLESPPVPKSEIALDRWRDALGRENPAEWLVLFERELERQGWRALLTTWLPRLAPGLIAGAAHGAIRTAHAARAIAAKETPARQAELARGLAYWASCWETLPGWERAGGERAAPVPRSEACAAEPRSPRELLFTLPRMPKEMRGGPFFTDALRALNDYPSFADVIDCASPDRDLDVFYSDLSAAAAECFLAGAGRGGLIALVHAVTAAAAARELSRFVANDARTPLAKLAWQSIAALHVALGESDERPRVDASSLPPRDELVQRVIATGEEHAIKLVEACLREHALRADPVYLAAAADGLRRFEALVAYQRERA